MLAIIAYDKNHHTSSHLGDALRSASRLFEPLKKATLDVIIIPILQMRKLRREEVKSLAQREGRK